MNDRGAQIRKAEPSTPVEVLGLESLPEAGDDFQVVTDTAKAKQIVNFRDLRAARSSARQESSRLTLEQLHKQMQAGEVKELPIIIKADVGGSAEVLTETLQKLSNDKVKVRVIHSGVGAINESDVLLASASNAIVIGFNVRPERNAAARGGAGKGGYPPAHHHLQPDRRDQEGHDAACWRRSSRKFTKARRRCARRSASPRSATWPAAGAGWHPSRSKSRNPPAARQRGGAYRQDRLAAALQGRRERSEERQECGITLENYGDVKQGDIIEAFVTERVATEVFAVMPWLPSAY